MTREQYDKLEKWSDDNCTKFVCCCGCPMGDMELCGYKEDYCLKIDFTDEMRVLVGETKIDNGVIPQQIADDLEYLMRELIKNKNCIDEFDHRRNAIFMLCDNLLLMKAIREYVISWDNHRMILDLKINDRDTLTLTGGQGK